MTIYEHVPSLRIAHRKETGAPKAADQHAGDGPLKRLNTRIGLGITRRGRLDVGRLPVHHLGAYVPAGRGQVRRLQIIIVAWVAQTFLQLVLLPIIIVGQNVQAKAADARSEATYKYAKAVLSACLKLDS